MNKLLRLIALAFWAVPCWAGTFTAATCNQSDVNAVINGPTHTAVNGDIILIPSGTCTWTTDVAVSVNITIQGNGTPNTLASQFGSGTLNTIIKDNFASGPLFQVQIAYAAGTLLRISTLDIEPQSSSTSLSSPISLSGTCSASACQNVRIDNIGFGITTQWNEAGNSSNADWMIRTDNVVGVLDHNTLPSGSQVELFNANLSAYLGVGAFGDNSWATADTFGTGANLYAENNSVFSDQAMYDCDTAPTGGAIGGCRVVVRFNHFSEVLNTFALGIVHGLDTDGRPQSGRSQVAYGNTINCTLSNVNECGDSTVSFRGGTGIVFGNTMTSTGGASFSAIADGNIYRRVLNASGGWGACGGSSAYDTDDGVTYFSGTATSGTSGLVLHDTSQTWTTNQLVPAGAGYSVHDVTAGFWAEIVSNTSNTLTINSNIPETSNAFTVGDSYTILRATICVDQVGRGAGNLVSGSTPSPASALNQALDPVYAWDNSGSGLVTHTGFGVSYGTNVEGNRDWYTDAMNGSPTVQTSPTSPFTGATGVGFGTLANRPTTCTPSVGYFATDQGSWNTSGNGFGQGELFVCTGTNTWSLNFTPFAYPNPLTSGGNSGTGGSGASQVCAGFLPYPCARQDLAVQQESSLNLALNNDGTTNYGINFPAGSVYIDPDFGEQIVRVSDNNWTGAACFNSNTQNTLLHNDDNPDLHSISSDDQWFSVVDTNANYFLYKFNPTTLAVTCEPTTASNKQMPWEPIFLHHTAGQMVGPDPVSSGTPWIIQTANVSSLPGLTTSTLVDFSGSTSPNCGAGNATWLTGIPIPTKMFGSSPGMWISNDDSTYELTLGPGQNQDWGSFFYNKTNGECAWVDTRTGQVGGNLVTTGTLSGAFPLDWGSPRAPTAPTATQTTGGSLTTGHTYDVCYALSEQTNNDGVGETSCSTVQRVTLTASNTAITLPSPPQCSNGANCDNMMWNYFNIYANDEANCSNAQCAASSLFLQPAANLGCSLATPGALTITQHGTAGSTNYTYVEEAWNNNCMTWVSTTTNTGNATLTTSNYNQIAMSTVSGATWYRLIGGGPGNSTAWASTVYGTSSVDAASPSGGGTVLYPAEMYQGSTPNTSFQDTGSEGLAFDALGTIPICAGLTPGSQWLSGGICSFQNEVTGTVSTSGTAVTGTNFNTQWSSSTVGGMLINGVLYPLVSCASTSACTLGSSAGTQSNVTYHVGIYSGVNNNAVLTAIATSGPTAPTKSTLGLFQHASIMGRSGTWHEWGQENTFTSNVLWNLGTLTDVMCNVNKANEYPSAGTYFNCPGHGVMGFSHETLGTGSSNVTSPAAGSDVNFNQLCVNLDSSFPANSNGIFLTSHCGNGSGQTFPALDSNGTASYDQHQTWAPSVTYGTDTATPYQTCWETGQSTPSFQYPGYIGRGFAMECDDFMPDGTFRRYFHHRASGFPYYTTSINCTGNCLQTGLVSYGTETDDGQWALFSSSLDSSCGCDPRQVYSLSSFSAGNPASVTVSATNNGSTNAAPLQGQTVTIVGSSGVAGLNGQWTLGTVSGSAPNYTMVLTGSNLSGTLTGGSLQMCTFDSSGRVNGPVAASTCGVGGNVACKVGSANTSIWLAQKK